MESLATDYLHFVLVLEYGHGLLTYLIGHYTPSVRIIDLVSHTTYVVCVNFIHMRLGPTVLKSIPNDIFF